MAPPVRRMVLLSRVEETVVCDGWSTPLACNEYPGADLPPRRPVAPGVQPRPVPPLGLPGPGVDAGEDPPPGPGQNAVVLSYTLLGGGRRARRGAAPAAHVRPPRHPRFDLPVERPPGGRGTRARPPPHPAHRPHARGVLRPRRRLRGRRPLVPEHDLPPRAAAGLRRPGGPVEPRRGPVVAPAGADGQLRLRHRPDRPAPPGGRGRRPADARAAAVAQAAGGDDALRRLLRAADQFVLSVPGRHAADGSPPPRVRRRRLPVVAAQPPPRADRLLRAVPGARPVHRRPRPARAPGRPPGGRAPPVVPDRGRRPAPVPRRRPVPVVRPRRPQLPPPHRRRGRRPGHPVRRRPVRRPLVPPGDRPGHPHRRRRAAATNQPGVPTTWMDALADGWVVTPRGGKAVEVNALWHNALAAPPTWPSSSAGPPRRPSSPAWPPPPRRRSTAGSGTPPPTAATT